MNRTLGTTVLALPLALAMTLGASAAYAATDEAHLPFLGGIDATSPVPPGIGEIANPEDDGDPDPEPPLPGPGEFANPEPGTDPDPEPEPPAPVPPAAEPVDEEEVVEDEEEVVEEETVEDETESAAAENGVLQGLPLVGLIAGLVALGATIVAVLLARRSRKRTV